MSTTQKTMDEVLRGVALTMSTKRVPCNPHMTDSDNMDHWQCVLKCGDNKMMVYFSKGYGHHGAKPTREEVLDCLASDASSIENSPKFEDWASECGCDIDSRKAEKTWKICTDQAIRLGYLLGPSLYKTLLWDTERL